MGTGSEGPKVLSRVLLAGDGDPECPLASALPASTRRVPVPSTRLQRAARSRNGGVIER